MKFNKLDTVFLCLIAGFSLVIVVITIASADRERKYQTYVAHKLKKIHEEVSYIETEVRGIKTEISDIETDKSVGYPRKRFKSTIESLILGD